MPFDAGNIDAGNTAWILASCALVLFMTPGLAFFYGGMVRAKNVLAMLMQNFFCMGLVSVLWAAVAYTLAFHGTGKFICNDAPACLHDALSLLAHALLQHLHQQGVARAYHGLDA